MSLSWGCHVSWNLSEATEYDQTNLLRIEQKYYDRRDKIETKNQIWPLKDEFLH